MAMEVVDLKCPGCGAPLDTTQTNCKYCARPIVVRTLNTFSTMNKEMADKYQTVYKGILKEEPNNAEVNASMGMYLLNMPYPLMIGVLVGLINIIPMIGAYIGGAIGMFMVFTVDPMMSLGFLVYLCILQQFESNVIYPRVVGSSVGLPGIYVMMTVVVFGSLAGIPGMFLGIPTVASIYKLAKIHIQNKEKELETKKLESKTSVKN